MTIRNFNSIYSSQSTAVASDLINEVTTSKWDNKFDGLTLFNSQVRVAKLLTVDGATKVGGTLAASGAVNFGSTLAASGAVNFGNSLDVVGYTHLGGVTVKGGINGVGSNNFGLSPVNYGANYNSFVQNSYARFHNFGHTALTTPYAHILTLEGAALGAEAVGNQIKANGHLSVAGDTTLSGVLKGPPQFTIDPAAYGNETGTVIVRGNLVSNGALAASGAVTVGGATTLNNTLYGAGAASFGSTLAASGAVTVGGATTLNNTLYGAGAATFGGNLAASGAVAFGNTLSVAGDTTLSGVLKGPVQMVIDPAAYGDETGTVTVRGNLVSNGTLAASGAVTVGGATTLNNTLYCAATATFGSNLDASGTITSGGHVFIGPQWGNSNLIANGNTNKIGPMIGSDFAFTVASTKNTGLMGRVQTFNSSFTVAGNVPTTLGGTLHGSGAATFGSTLAASGAAAFGSTLSVTGNTTLSNLVANGTLGASGAVNFGTTLNVASTGSFGALTVSGDTTLSGVLRGPPDFIIDPSAYNDETGTVTIRGNLLVKGLTTTINSATLDVADLNLTLAKGSLTKTTSNGAGLTIELGTGGLAEFKYQDTADNFRVNKLVRCASGPVDVDDLTNKAYVDARIVAAASTITPNTIGLSLINGFKFKVITVAGDFSGTDICMTENNILYIWNNGGSFSVDLPYIHVGVPGVKSTPLYNGMNMFGYRVTAANAEDHWTDSV